MSQHVTIDDIWKMFEETNRMFKESEARAEARSREREREFQEIRRAMQESSAKTDRQMQETDRKLKEVSKLVGNLGGRWGEFVEGLVAPACETMFMERGIPVHKVHPRTRASLPGNRHMEIDLLVIDGTAVVIVEVKSELKVDDVRRHMERLGEFKEFYPEYADRRIMGAVAGIVIDQGVEQFAMKQGLFVIVQAGESVRLANDMAFVPRLF
ncbi:MAG: DUF3782 domain-containing protein [Magnetococcales bacterium]|nr:DUF3782 domain-containing protein [Magnetococcales bacterium]